MATVVNRPGGAVFLELDGQPAGMLRSAQPPGLQVEMTPLSIGPDGRERRAARVAYGALAATADLAEPGPLVDWLQAALAGDLSPRAGALLVADINHKQRRRIAFRGAQLTTLTWPALDASDGKQPLTLDLRALVDGVDELPGDGKALPAPGRRKTLLTANFRVVGLPFDGNAVGRVQLPTLQVTWLDDRVGGRRPSQRRASRQLGALSLTVTARQADAARAWVRKLVADGLVDEGDALSLQVELLDAALKKVLVTVQLDGCLLLGMDEDPLGGTDRLPGLTLHFDVAGMAFRLA
jgi:hypothetical protein